MKGNSRNGCSSVRTHEQGLTEFLTHVADDLRDAKPSDHSNLYTALNSPIPLSQDQTILFLSSINKLKSSSNDSENITSVFSVILNSNFISNGLEPFVMKYVENVEVNENIEIMIQFLLNCLELVPEQTLRKLILLYPCVIYSGRLCPSTGLSVLLEQLISCFEKTKKDIWALNSPGSLQPTTACRAGRRYRGASVFPQFDDIFPSLHGDFSTVTGNGDERMGFESVEHYLEEQFYSRKCDFVRPIRDAIPIIKDKLLTNSRKPPCIKQINLYENVSIDGLYPSQSRLVYRVVFDVSKFNKNIKWDKCDRFKYGSLLCFTNNVLETISFASVVENDADKLSQGILLVQFIEEPVANIISDNSFVMIETKIRIDAFSPLLAKLQTFTSDSLPFRHSIVFGKHLNKPPSFLSQSNLKKLSALVDDELNESENEALAYGLRCDFALIKGLRDTGKNKVCLKMIGYMIDHYQAKKKNFSPILVLFYTNKALEEFVFEAVGKVGAENIVRLGSLGKSDRNKECNITSIKHDWVQSRKFPPQLFNRFKTNMKRLASFEETLVRMNSEIRNCHRRLISFNNLSPFMSSKHRAYFQTKDFYNWLNGKEAIKTECLLGLTEEMFHLMADIVSEVIRDILENDILVNGPEIMTEEVGTTTDIFKCTADRKLIKKYINSSPPITTVEVDELDSLDVAFTVRLRLYKFWSERYREDLRRQYELEKKEYDILIKEKEDIVFQEYYHIMMTRRVLVMTSTLAIKNAPVLDQIGCRIVIVQEASKVPECHVVCSLSQSCQQLIMIGDDEPSVNCINGSYPHDDGTSTVSFFDQLISDGCHCLSLEHLCSASLPCGHLCTLPYHPESPSHLLYTCQVTCNKLCVRKIHKCQLSCSQTCKCEEEVVVGLGCGHQNTIPCCQSEIDAECDHICGKLLICGHKCLNKCGQECSCHEKRKKVLECGHQWEGHCGADISINKCMHLCNMKLNCGHRCRMKCWQSCACAELVKHILPCLHVKMLKCGIDKSVSLCIMELQRQFDCGHIISYKCFEKIDKCNFEIKKELPCKHTFIAKCSEVPKEIICKSKCNVKLDCQHLCQGVCGDCYYGYLHVDCKKKCEKYLKCGHDCISSCHSGFCPPCTRSCVKYCEHSQCTKPCGFSCNCKPCQRICHKDISCTKCEKVERCSALCGEPCSALCTECFVSTGRMYGTQYNMEPCNCLISKKMFKPKLKIEAKDLSLLCQKCQKCLCSPYSGLLLLFFKDETSSFFQSLPKSRISQWITLFNDLQMIDYYPDNCRKLKERIESRRIFKKDVGLFESSYQFHLEVMDICKQIAAVEREKQIGKYKNDIKKTLIRLIQWLNPFKRDFNAQTHTRFQMVKVKLKISIELLLYLTEASVTDYALIHKQFFDILDDMDNVTDVDKLCVRVDEIKKNLKNTRESTKEEEELVKRINRTKNIFKEFGIDSLSTENQLKEIKNLIRSCHPDKNNSVEASEAVKILLAEKNSLDKKILKNKSDF